MASNRTSNVGHIFCVLQRRHAAELVEAQDSTVICDAPKRSSHGVGGGDRNEDVGDDPAVDDANSEKKVQNGLVGSRAINWSNEFP